MTHLAMMRLAGTADTPYMLTRLPTKVACCDMLTQLPVLLAVQLLTMSPTLPLTRLSNLRAVCMLTRLPYLSAA